MTRKKANQGLADIFKKTEPGEPGAALDKDYVTPRGLSLKNSEWAELDTAAEFFSMSNHKFLAWLVRWGLKQYREGKIPATSKKVNQPPDL